MARQRNVSSCPALGLLFFFLLTLGCGSEDSRWAEAQKTDNAKAYEAFLAKHPNSQHAAAAKSRVEELDWAAAESANTEEQFNGFLKKHPESTNTEAARRGISNIQKTEMHRAAEKGDLEKVRALLDQGRDINGTEGGGASPLHMAADKCGDAVVALLISRGADVNIRGDDDATPLHWAARAGCIPVMRRLLDAGADLNIDVRAPFSGFYIDEKGTATSFGEGGPKVLGTALHWAAAAGQTQAASLLIERGAEVGRLEAGGLSPLHYAAQSGAQATVEMLLSKGSPWHFSESDWGQPIHYAKTGAIAALLVDRGEDPNRPSEFRGKPIHNAAYLGNADAVSYFLGRGVPVDELGEWNVMDSGFTSKVTPLWAAACGGHVEIVKLLESHGGDLKFTTPRGMLGGSLLHAAAAKGRTDVVAYLLAKAVPVDARAEMRFFPLVKPWSNVTPLEVAARYGQVPVIEALLKGGANIDVVSDEDWTPIKLAIVAQKEDAVTCLLSHGAKPQVTADMVDHLNTSDVIKAIFRERLVGTKPQ